MDTDQLLLLYSCSLSSNFCTGFRRGFGLRLSFLLQKLNPRYFVSFDLHTFVFVTLICTRSVSSSLPVTNFITRFHRKKSVHLHLRRDQNERSDCIIQFCLLSDKQEFAKPLNRIAQMNIKRSNQQFLQIFIVVLEKEFYSLAVVFFCVKLPV